MLNENNMFPESVDPVIFSIINNQVNVLLLKRNQHPFNNQWALPGGLMERTDITLEGSISRVLKNKTGITPSYMEQLVTRTGHDPRGPTISIAYLALGSDINVSGSEWFTLEKAKNMNLAFDHNKVIEIAWERLVAKANYSTVPVYLLPELFTLPELYNIYNIILGTNKSNSRFRSKIDESGGVEKTEETRHRGAARPPNLYKASKDSPKYFSSNYIR